jgi:hypothetical protein
MTPAEALIAAHDRRAELARIEAERAANVAKFAAGNPDAECNIPQFEVIK